ncbi:YicC family protein [Paenibacillus sp. TRM 82003]|nr:YicC family protein [Paenibacillus sp. TRM 82003]
MLRSMTGYGHDSRSIGPIQFTVGMKSVNHRYAEIVLRLPREWNHMEERLRRMLQGRLKRGRVEVTIAAERSGDAAFEAVVDWPLADAYVDAANRLAARYGIPPERGLTVNELLAAPGVFSHREAAPPDEAEETLCACAESALSALLHMRETEGRFLAEDARRKLSGIEALLERMRETTPAVVEEYRAKLQERIETLLGGNVPVDRDRLAAEAAYFAERTGIDEELTRLASHAEQFAAMMSLDEPVGRKLDFLLQEMNREANTIGSKANHAGLAALVVDMKAELEKLREQVQNVE